MTSSALTLASIYKALADETRIQMLALLLERPELCVCHVEQALNITQSKTSRHLRYLLNAGLLTGRREGTWMYYRLADGLSPELRALVESVGTMLDPAALADLRYRLEAAIGATCAASDC